MSSFKHVSPYGEFQLIAEFSNYKNGQNAITLWDTADGFPYAKASLCAEDELLESDEVAIKDYSENVGILESLIEAEIIDHPHAFIWTGHVRVPICKILKR